MTCGFLVVDLTEFKRRCSLWGVVGGLVAPAVVVVDCCSRRLAWSPVDSASSHLISLLEETHHHTPSFHVATESTSRVHSTSTARQRRQTQSSSTAAGWRSAVRMQLHTGGSRHDTHGAPVPVATVRLWMAPQKRPISRSRDAQDFEVTRPTTTDFNMVAEQSFIHHGNTVNGHAYHIQRSSSLSRCHNGNTLRTVSEA